MKSDNRRTTTSHKSWRQVIKSLVLRSGILRFYAANFLPQEAAILCYHSIAVDREGQDDYISKAITVDANLFDEHMRVLREKYHPVTLDDIADWMAARKKLPTRSVAVTFDDGFEDNYTVAAPIMEKYGIFGTFYLTAGAVRKNELPWFCRTTYLFHEAKRRNMVLTDTKLQRTWNLGNPDENREAFVHYSNPCATESDRIQEEHVERLENWFGFKLDLSQGPRMMSFAEARELRQRGHIVGNHSFTHDNIGHVPPEALHHEIVEANEMLEQELGGKPEHFSYPHPCFSPQWSEQSLAVTKQLGFKTAVLTDHGVVTKASNPLLLHRVIPGNEDADAFCWRLDNEFVGRAV